MSEECDGELDPRIQVELEKLNSTTDEINKLELEYDVSFVCFFAKVSGGDKGLVGRKQTRPFVCS